MKLNDEDGFPHSEICGSKVAHTSPQLIAACHVLHRLCMPRHPPNALTSRLRIRTTNDSTGCIIRRSPCGGTVVISAFNCERQQLFAKNSRAATASILRTHSQCQRWPTLGPTARFRTDPVFFIWRIGGASRDRTDDLKLAKLALSQLSYGPMLAINR